MSVLEEWSESVPCVSRCRQFSQEECAVWYAQKVGTPHTEKAKFNENFFREFKKVLGSGHAVQKFAALDFTAIRQFLDQEKVRCLCIGARRFSVIDLFSHIYCHIDVHD
jgi:hypothetical protein